MKAIVKNYCGFPVEVISVREYGQDEKGRFFFGRVRYEEDGFVKGAFIREHEVELVKA